MVIEVPDPLLSGDDWLVRSMFTTHVGVTDVLLMVPLKIYDVLRWEDGRLHGRQVRPSATGRPRETCKDLVVICFTFKIIFVSYGM